MVIDIVVKTIKKKKQRSRRVYMNTICLNVCNDIYILFVAVPFSFSVLRFILYIPTFYTSIIIYIPLSYLFKFINIIHAFCDTLRILPMSLKNVLYDNMITDAFLHTHMPIGRVGPKVFVASTLCFRFSVAV